jgi:pilus assembly protein Flp/PilA
MIYRRAPGTFSIRREVEIGFIRGNAPMKQLDSSGVFLSFSTKSRRIPVPISDRGGCRVVEQPMKTLALNVQHFLVSEDGPTAVEYAVMLAFIIIVCIIAIQAVGTNVNATFNSMASKIPTGGS